MAVPASTIKVVSMEPVGDTKVRIMMEMIVDVHRLAEVGSEMLHAAMAHVKAEKRAQGKSKA
jgi:hypothetical protein